MFTIIASIILGFSFFMSSSYVDTKTNSIEDPRGIVIPTPQIDIKTDGHFWGKADSKVVITVWSDLQCPFCAKFHDNVEAKLKQNYGDEIKFVFKHFPLSSHKNAQIAAEASEAAAAQGKFFEYVDLLYKKQEAESKNWTVTTLTGYAGELGLDEAKFRSELSSLKYYSLIQAYENEATKKQLYGTPTVEINGKLLESNELNYDSIKEIIDGFLK